MWDGKSSVGSWRRHFRSPESPIHTKLLNLVFTPMFGEFHALSTRVIAVSCPAPPCPSPSHLLHSVSVLGTHCSSVNICCMDELVCAPSLCAFLNLACPSPAPPHLVDSSLWSLYLGCDPDDVSPYVGGAEGSVTLFTAAFILPDLQLSHHSVTIHSHTCFHHQLVAWAPQGQKMGLDTIGFSVPSAMPGLCQQLNLTPTIKHNCGRDPNILLCS